VAVARPQLDAIAIALGQDAIAIELLLVEPVVALGRLVDESGQLELAHEASLPSYLFARIRLFFGLCSTSASPSASSTGGTYMPKRPRRPFFRPYQPPTGFFDERPQASTVPSAAGFCSSALPSGIQSPCFLSAE